VARRTATVDLDAVLAALLAEGADEKTSREIPLDGATEALLDATSDLLAERGTRGWTMDDVARRAGIGRATVYRRFTGREQLVGASIRRDGAVFFAAVADSVAGVESLEDKVVNGFVVGLGLARRSPLGALIARDAAAAWSLVSSAGLLEGAARALAERYEVLAGVPTDPRERKRVQAVAEALIRLGLSFLLLPGRTGDADADQAHEHVAGIIRPLVATRSSPPRSARPRP
jgi:AcrR family transcriptional regulator